MSIFVDDAALVFKGKPRFHLAGSNVQELHDFARKCGIARCWFHAGARIPHYDIVGAERIRAIQEGAQPVSSKELVRLMREPKEVPGL